MANEHEDVQVVGEAADSGDKVASKCMTMALKYAIRQWLVLETGDDPDKHPSGSGEGEGKRTGAFGVGGTQASKRVLDAEHSLQACKTHPELDTVERRIKKSEFNFQERGHLDKIALQVREHITAREAKREAAASGNGSK